MKYNTNIILGLQFGGEKRENISNFLAPLGNTKINIVKIYTKNILQKVYIDSEKKEFSISILPKLMYETNAVTYLYSTVEMEASELIREIKYLDLTIWASDLYIDSNIEMKNIDESESNIIKERLNDNLSDKINQIIYKKDPLLIESSISFMKDGLSTHDICNKIGINESEIDNRVAIFSPYITNASNYIDYDSIIKKGNNIANLGTSYAWIDIPMLKYAIEKCNINSLCFTNIDSLKSCEKIRVVLAYEYMNKIYDKYDPNMELENLIPIYEERFEVSESNELLLEYIERNLRTKINYVSYNNEVKERN